MKSLHLRIYGRVQGVGFRWAAARKAQELGLYGWVRNCADGCVKTEVEGTEAAVEKYHQWCKKGPMWARVKRVEEAWGDAAGEYNDFKVR